MLQANFTTDCPPDSLEWCPIRSDLFACGTYLYNPENTTREGSIYLFQYNDSDRSLNVVHHQKTVGILDLKWISPTTDVTLLSTVSALGQLSLYSLNDMNKPLICEDVTTDQTIALSHSWFHQTNSYVLISDQQGSLSLCELGSTNGLRFSQSWSAHEYECWTCEWDRTDPNIVYSGADDTFLKVWDIRQTQQAIHINRKHTMGICSILSNVTDPNEFLTGSFDEYLRRWDKRKLNEPIQSIRLGGGVWKLRPSSNDPQRLLCACMQHGFVIVDLKSSKIECHYQGHESLAYGCDWQQKEIIDNSMMNDEEMTNVTSESLIASCSFYDKTVHIWKQKI